MEYKLCFMRVHVLDTRPLRVSESPRFPFGSPLGVMRESQMLMEMCWFWPVLLWVVITMGSALSYNFKSLLVIIFFLSWYRPQEGILLSPLILVQYTTEHHSYNDESSILVFEWYSQEGLCTYKKIGSSTEPWGTPYFNVPGIDEHDPIWTICVRP